MIKTDNNIKGIFLIGYERDSSKHEADYHAKMLTSKAWLMTIFDVKHTTVGIVATCSRRCPDLEPSITAEIAHYTHGSLITQNCQWKYLLRSTASKIPIRHHHQLQETAWPNSHARFKESTWDPEVFIIIIIIFPFWWLSFNKHSISL